MTQLTPQILAMYLGCECEYKDEDGNELIMPLLTINLQGYAKFVDPEFDEWIEIKDVKPILRPLSDMSEEEAEQCAILTGKLKVYKGDYWQFNKSFMNITQYQAFNVTSYLLSKSFDLFGLIDSGIAVDKTKNGNV